MFENTQVHEVKAAALEALPAADIHETDAAIVVLTDMPGVPEAALEVSIEQDVLTVSGTQERPSPQDYTLAYGSPAALAFRRSFNLGQEIDRERIEARLANGVLQLTLPKRAPLAPRKVQVLAA